MGNIAVTVLKSTIAKFSKKKEEPMKEYTTQNNGQKRKTKPWPNLRFQLKAKAAKMKHRKREPGSGFSFNNFSFASAIGVRLSKEQNFSALQRSPLVIATPPAPLDIVIPVSNSAPSAKLQQVPATTQRFEQIETI